jgi:hypothetical protein
MMYLIKNFNFLFFILFYFVFKPLPAISPVFPKLPTRLAPLFFTVPVGVHSLFIHTLHMWEYISALCDKVFRLVLYV